MQYVRGGAKNTLNGKLGENGKLITLTVPYKIYTINNAKILSPS